MTHFYRPTDGHGLAHDPFNAIVAPRPIGWISSVSADGARNLAPYSFFNAFNYRPPIVGFCSIGRKDSVANLEATGEFVWNLVTRDLAEAMNRTSTADSVDEWGRAGVAAAASVEVTPERVADSPVSFECRVTQVVRLLDQHGVEIDAWMTFGEVVGVHIDEQFLVDGVYDTAAAQPVMRAGGPSAYYEVGDRFDLHRPS
ncbi:flavin reductase family protein [Nocardioides sp.]|uniref:flavin reductase family protein n=1 Tax=Nocardioides sp. TaxID=35761 RepID=UPI00271BD50F|nr:flavin reductase family protein [Nocardioides sp.]MDO9456347.1 flavin reductase family protein [Nocardioides sp.]